MIHSTKVGNTTYTLDTGNSLVFVRLERTSQTDPKSNRVTYFPRELLTLALKEKAHELLEELFGKR